MYLICKHHFKIILACHWHYKDQRGVVNRSFTVLLRPCPQTWSGIQKQRESEKCLHGYTTFNGYFVLLITIENDVQSFGLSGTSTHKSKECSYCLCWCVTSIGYITRCRSLGDLHTEITLDLLHRINKGCHLSCLERECRWQIAELMDGNIFFIVQ